MPGWHNLVPAAKQAENCVALERLFPKGYLGSKQFFAKKLSKSG